MSGTDKAAVFIDGGYLASGLHNWGIRNVDQYKLSRRIVGSHRLLRTYYYDCPPYQSPVPTEDEQRRVSGWELFYNALSQLPRFEVRLGYLRFEGTRSNGDPIYRQKGTDVLLALDMLRLSLQGKIDIAYLLAGDGDFLPVVRAVKDSGVSVRLYSFYENCSSELWQACDEREYMNRAMFNDLILSRSSAPS